MDLSRRKMAGTDILFSIYEVKLGICSNRLGGQAMKIITSYHENLTINEQINFFAMH